MKRFSAVELTDAHIAAVERARALNAYVLETLDHATVMAKASDACIAKGDAGPLEGIPLAMKDTFCTKNVRTTACSRILGNFVPTYELTVTAQLWRDGAVLLGKTNNDEFGMGSSNETSFYGPVIHPGGARAVVRRSRRAEPPADRPRRWPPSFVSARPAPTPAVRSASLLPLPARSALSPPMAACRVGGSWPSHRRSIRRGQSPGPCATQQSCCV